jgi:hypothetical protein
MTNSNKASAARNGALGQEPVASTRDVAPSRAETGNLHGKEPAKLRVLVACEFSGTVRDAFIRAGHDAVSCDLLPTESQGPHHVGDATELLGEGWDLLIAHPPCTRLTNAGVRWLDGPPKGKTSVQMWAEMREGAALFSRFLNAPIPRICIENPLMHKHAKAAIAGYVEFSQSVQPWQFGHGETKRTCFWLKGLPLLKPTNIVDGRHARVHLASPGPDRWKERSKFFTGIADAMADQWAGNIASIRESEAA